MDKEKIKFTIDKLTQEILSEKVDISKSSKKIILDGINEMADKLNKKHGNFDRIK